MGTVIPFGRPLSVPRVEISSPGFSEGGRWMFFVDIVDHDGAVTMWGGQDLEEARRAARECADDGDGRTIPIVDLTSTIGVRQ